MKVSVQWKGGLRFAATNERDGMVEIDATQVEGKIVGLTPMELLLIALGGCTGIDVSSILEKQRQNVVDLTVNVIGQRRDEHPRYFEKIQVEYVLTGKNLEDSKVQRAIELSQEKYCSVQSMLHSSATITSSYTIINK